MVDFAPYVCGDCGNLDLMSDTISNGRPGNCRACTGDNVRRAGPKQRVEVRISKPALQMFEKGEEKQKR